MDVSKYKSIYLREAKEHLSNIERCLLSLEKGSDKKTLDELFRRFHSIKGMSASMGYEPIARLAHAQEDLLDRMRTGRMEATGEVVSALLYSYDGLKDLVGLAESGDKVEAQVTVFLERIKRASEATEDKVAPSAPVADQPMAHTKEAGPEARTEGALRLSNIMRVEASVFDDLLSRVGEMYTALSILRGEEQAHRSIQLKEGVHRLARSVSAIHQSIMDARMVPVEELFAGLPRLVRDLTHATGKSIDLKVTGGEISLDRATIDALSSPVVHIIRNSIDHGIETGEERVRAGKERSGAISIRAFADKGRIFMEFADDGRGINIRRLKAKAVEKGVPEEFIATLNDKEVLSLICIPGVTTADVVTETSGRGVGMDVVKDAVTAIGGGLSIDTREGGGTSITLELPRSSSIIKALHVKVQDESFMIPMSRIEKVFEVAAEVLSAPSIGYEGVTVPVVPLWKAMGMTGERELDSYFVVLVKPDISARGKGRAGDASRFEGVFGIKVDGLVGETDAYIKALGPPMARLWGVSGITILGDGRPVFLVDVKQACTMAVFGMEGAGADRQ